MEYKPLRLWRTKGFDAFVKPHGAKYKLFIRFRPSETWRKAASIAYSTQYGMAAWSTREEALDPENVRTFVEAVQRGSACSGAGGSSSQRLPSVSDLLATPEGPPTRSSAGSDGLGIASDSELLHAEDSGVTPMDLDAGGAFEDAQVEAAMEQAALCEYKTIVLKIGEVEHEFGVSLCATCHASPHSDCFSRSCVTDSAPRLAPGAGARFRRKG